MNASSFLAAWIRPAVLVAGGLAATLALAFPPAPHHLVYGMVRDEMGNPLDRSGGEVWLDTGVGSPIRTTIAAGSAPGVNYRLAIPLDSGSTPDLYKPTALRPMVPFRMRVKLGNVTYLPIEMTGAADLVTRPGASSRLDLTLGVDSDGDGLPDAWERALMLAIGSEWTLDDIRPDDDTDGDGLTNLHEYLAGTYAFDPADGILLNIASVSDGQAVLEFTAIRGRNYTIQGSDDLEQWTPLSFALPTDIPDAAKRPAYQAAETSLIRARVGPPDEGAASFRFFKLLAR